MNKLNPGDYLLLLISLTFATLSLIAHGWTASGVGPAFLAAAGGFWQLLFQWLRYRSWQKHKDTDFIPGTQHLAISAWLGWALTNGAAILWSMLTLKELRP